MIIKEIELHNFKKIKDFKQSFEGDVYLVTGENEIGKTTLLKAIAIALTGVRSESLTKGEESGFVKMIIGSDSNEYEVELKMTEKNPKGTLSIKDLASGIKTSSITALQDIFKYQDFDASEFTLWSNTAAGRKKQVEIVKSLLPKKVIERINEIDGLVETAKLDRKEKNAETRVHENIIKDKEQKFRAQGINVMDYMLAIPIEELNENFTYHTQLNQQIISAKERYDKRMVDLSGIDARKDELFAAAKKEIDSKNDDLERLKRKYEAKCISVKHEVESILDKRDLDMIKIDEEKADLEDKNKKADAYFAENEIVPIESISKEITDATTHNEICAKVKEVTDAKLLMKKSVNASLAFDKQIDKLIKEKADLINKSKLPIKGLSFTDDGLTLNGIQFQHDEVSTSQEMEVATKLIIAKNPNVKVFRVARGESLGSAKLEALVKFAKDNGYQGFIEDVRRGQKELVTLKYSEK